MRLSARFLNDVASVNSYEAVANIEINQGDAQNLYIQLVDLSVDRVEQGFNPSGRRYMPAVGATMTCTLTNTDTGPSTDITETMAPRLNPSAPSQVVRAGAQPFPQDASIWAIPLLNTDPLNGTVNLTFTLTEGAKTTTFSGAPRLFLRVV